MKTMVYVANSKAGGISAFELDRGTSSLRERGQSLAERGVAVIGASPDRRFLYAAARGDTQELAAFAIDNGSGVLHLLNTLTVAERYSYLSVDAGGRFLLAASYGDDVVSVFPLGPDGFLAGRAVCQVRDGRNPHCVVADGSNRFVYTPVLGSNCVRCYRFDANTGQLRPNTPPFVSAAREAGPRHMVLSPDNRYAFVLMEMGGEIVSCAVCPETGALAILETVPLLPAERALPKGTYTPPINATGGPNAPCPVMWAADIRVSPDGKWLYASERTNSTLSGFRIDPVSGRLDFIGVTDTEKIPRGFAFDPLGKYVFVPGEGSGWLRVYEVDAASGELHEGGRYQVGVGPTWVNSLMV